MPEGFNKTYRRYAEAAKTVGLERDTRKLTAEDPSLLFEDRSEELRENLDPEQLTSFFNALQGDTDAPPRDILDIGNMLYAYRPGRQDLGSEGRHAGRETSIHPLDERDRQLVDLACGLLENSFYKGSLLRLNEKQTASIAFVVNTLAKILEGKDTRNGLLGFNQEKLTSLMERLHEYEQKTLFPNEHVPGTEGSVSDEGVNAIGREIEEKIRLAEEKWPTHIRKEYFENAIKELESIYITIRSAAESEAASGSRGLFTGLWTKHSYWLSGAITGFRKYYPKLIAKYEKKTTEIRTESDGIKLTRQGDSYFAWDTPILLGALNEAGKEEDEGTIALNIKRTLNNLSEAITAEIGSGSSTGSKKLQGFQALAGAVANQRLPELQIAVSNAISNLLEAPKRELGEYLESYRNVGRLQQKAKDIALRDQLFHKGEVRLTNLMRNKGAVAIAYFIKTAIIASHMTRSEGNEKEEARLEVARQRQELPHEEQEQVRQGKQPSHLLISSTQMTGGEYRNVGPAFGNLHYIPDDIPYATWAVQYLRTEND